MINFYLVEYPLLKVSELGRLLYVAAHVLKNDESAALIVTTGDLTQYQSVNNDVIWSGIRASDDTLARIISRARVSSQPAGYCDYSIQFKPLDGCNAYYLEYIPTGEQVCLGDRLYDNLPNNNAQLYTLAYNCYADPDMYFGTYFKAAGFVTSVTIATDEALDVYRCECGFLIGLDSLYLERELVSIDCPNCGQQISPDLINGGSDQ